MTEMKETPEILMVHGGPGFDDSYFFPYLNALKSTCNLRSYRQKRAANLSELCVELSGKVREASKPIYLLGHSWGCMLIIESVRRVPLPLNVKGLVLISCAFDNSMNEEFEKMKSHWKLRPTEESSAGEDEKFRKSCLELVELFFTKESASEGERLFRRISYSAESLSKFFDEYLANFDLKPVIAGVKVPVLNIYGEEDYRIPASHSSKLQNLNPLIQNVAVPEAGHFPFVEQGDFVCSSIRRFLESSC